MSDKNSESFEEYCKNSPLLSYKANDVFKAVAEDAWNRQQKKIDELENLVYINSKCLNGLRLSVEDYEEKLQAAEEKIEHLQKIIRSALFDNADLAEENKTLREAVEFIASDDDDIDMIDGSWAVRTARQALEKVKRGGE